MKSANAAEVHAEELKQTERTRAAMKDLHDEGGRTFEVSSALCLSGGGIRSASFSMGVLQGLAERRLVSAFDYISAVSGGGYALGWWAALARRVPGPRNPRDSAHIVAAKARAAEDRIASNVATDLESDGELRDPFERRYVRAHGNYLTVRTGLLSPDTWAAVFTILRNFVFGIAGLGLFFVALAWQMLALLDGVGILARHSREWLAILAAAPVAFAWARTCNALYRDTSGLPNVMSGRTTLWLLAGGLASLAVFLAFATRTPTRLSEPSGAYKFALAIFVLLAIADACCLVFLAVNRRLTRQQRCYWIVGSSIGVLAWVTTLSSLAMAFWMPKVGPFLEDRFQNEPEQAYLSWLLIVMMHAWVVSHRVV
jgi:hypothetical protein